MTQLIKKTGQIINIKDNKDKKDVARLPNGKWKLNIVTQLDKSKFEDFNLDTVKFGAIFFDSEVFYSGDWMFVFIDTIRAERTVIANDRIALLKYYQAHKKECFIGYNCLRYDRFIMVGLLSGKKAPQDISNAIVQRGEQGWTLDLPMKDYPIIMYDCMYKQDLGSLKLLEGYMGHDIEETDVSFMKEENLTFDEMKLTMKYCIHDVEETIAVFRNSKLEYDSIESLVTAFGLSSQSVGNTKAQLSAIVLGCKKPEQPRTQDEWDLWIYPKLSLDKFKFVADWFMDKKNHAYNTHLDLDVFGVPHIIGWGGVHGAWEKPIHLTTEQGIDRHGNYIKGNFIYYHVDVTSYYPSMMLGMGFFTRNSESPEKYQQIYDTRVALKKAGKKKEQAPYKIVLNSTYGMFGDKTSKAYDPIQRNMICVTGQLGLLDLHEHLEKALGEDYVIIQSNTDGIILQIPNTQENIDKMMSVCKEWETRLGLGLDKDPITDIVQANVNSYWFKFANGKEEVKGPMLGEKSPLSNNLPIVNNAMRLYIANGCNFDIEKYVMENNNLIDFQCLYRLQGKYNQAWHNGEYLQNKTYRVFASTNPNDTFMGKCENDKINKFPSTPEHCFIENGNIESKLCSDYPQLNKQWYIDLIWTRLNNQFNMFKSIENTFDDLFKF